MKQQVDNLTIKGFYQRGIVLDNGHAPSNIGELFEWISENSSFTLHCQGFCNSKLGTKWKEWEFWSCGDCVTNGELLDALIEFANKIQDEKE